MTLSFMFTISLVGCGQCTTNLSSPVISTSTLTPIPIATTTPTFVSTKTLVPTVKTTSTLAFQILQNIFPPGFGQAGVAANQDDPNFAGLGGLHFDVGIPLDFAPEKDYILFPASGRIIEYYLPGDGKSGECITIAPEPPLQGIDELVLSKGYDPDDVKYVYFHLAHIVALKTSGWIDAGEEAGVVFNRMARQGQWSNIVAFVVRIGFENEEIQVSPCELPNNFNWCNICYPGALERNPCP